MVAEVYRAVLDKAGYEGDPTEQNVREMFVDYVDCGYFADIDPEEAEEITTEEICRVFLRMK